MDLVIYTPVRLFGEALAAALGEMAEFNVVTTCEAADQLADVIQKTKPDLVLFDLVHEGALAEARAVAASGAQVPVIALVLPEMAEKVIACADAGFTTWTLRDASVDELRDAIHLAHRDRTSRRPNMVTRLFRALRRRCGSNKPDEPPSQSRSDVRRKAHP